MVLPPRRHLHRQAEFPRRKWIVLVRSLWSTDIGLGYGKVSSPQLDSIPKAKIGRYSRLFQPLRVWSRTKNVHSRPRQSVSTVFACICILPWMTKWANFSFAVGYTYTFQQMGLVHLSNITLFTFQTISAGMNLTTIRTSQSKIKDTWKCSLSNYMSLVTFIDWKLAMFDCLFHVDLKDANIWIVCIVSSFIWMSLHCISSHVIESRTSRGIKNALGQLSCIPPIHKAFHSLMHALVASCKPNWVVHALLFHQERGFFGVFCIISEKIIDVGVINMR